MHRPLVSVLVLLLAATGCTPSPPGPQADAPARAAPRAAAQDAADPAAPLMAMPQGDAALAAAAAGGRWMLQESDPPRAVWGVPDSEAMLSLGCERGSGQLLLERQAIGVGHDVRVLSLEADDLRMDYPAERVDGALAPLLVTRIALDAPILDRLMIAARMAVVAGDDAIATTAPGASLRAVVDACRGAQPPA